MDIATYQTRAALTQPPVVHMHATPAQVISGVLHNVIHFAEDADAIKKGLVYGYAPADNPKGDRLFAYDKDGKGFVFNADLDQTAASELAHGTFGVLSEAGELAEALVTVLFGGDDIDWSNVKEEVGDFMWYLARIAKSGGFTLEEAMAGNIAKLEQRHLNKTGGFNPEAGTEAGRDREAEKAAMEQAPATKTALDKLVEVTKTASDPGNAFAHAYGHGMANGLILAESIMKDEEPVFLKWPEDKPLPADAPNLGLATNAEIDAEVKARTEMGHTAPSYRTTEPQRNYKGEAIPPVGKGAPRT